jgi:hypothetical protein
MLSLSKFCHFRFCDIFNFEMSISTHIMHIASFSQSNTSHSNSSDSDYELGKPLRFWLFLVLDIPAVLCSVFALYHLLAERSSRQALHNHATILILLFNFIYQLIDIPLHLQYFSLGIMRPATPALCLIWWFIDYAFFFISLVLLMWASFERHILIFHTWMVATQRKRLLVHYLPILVIVLSMMIFYGIAIFAPSCQNTFDYTADLCGTAGCYESVSSFAMIERVGFAVAPSFLIAIFSMALLARVVRQKCRFDRVVGWRKQRKLTINIVFMPLLYLCFDLPLSVIDLVHLCGQPDWAHAVLPTLFYYSYFPILLLPIVCIGSLPELRNKMKKLDPRRQRVVPAVTLSHKADRRSVKV